MKKILLSLIVITLFGCVDDTNSTYHNPVVIKVEKSHDYKNAWYIHANDGSSEITFHTLDSMWRNGDILNPPFRQSSPIEQYANTTNTYQYFVRANRKLVSSDTFVLRRIRSLEGKGHFISHLNLSLAENEIYRRLDTVWVEGNRPSNTKNAEVYIIEN